jgi:hypothetical protein
MKRFRALKTDQILDYSITGVPEPSYDSKNLVLSTERLLRESAWDNDYGKSRQDEPSSFVKNLLWKAVNHFDSAANARSIACKMLPL